MKKYYALYDTQLDGFKAGITGENFTDVLQDGAIRAFQLSQSDEEPCDPSLSDEEILENYGYEVKEVSEEIHQQILESGEIGLMTTVTLQGEEN